MEINEPWREVAVAGFEATEQNYLMLEGFDKPVWLSWYIPPETPLENFRCVCGLDTTIIAYCVLEEPTEYEEPLKFIYSPKDWPDCYPDIPWEKAEEAFFGSMFLDYHKKRGWVISSPEVSEEEAQMIERRRTALWKRSNSTMAAACALFLRHEHAPVFDVTYIDADSAFLLWPSNNAHVRRYDTLQELLCEALPLSAQECEARFRAFLVSLCEEDLWGYNACFHRENWRAIVEAIDASGASVVLPEFTIWASGITDQEAARDKRDRMLELLIARLSASLQGAG